nr:hypothetical protein [Vibrio splendidus]
MHKSALALMLLFLSTVASAAEYQQLANMCIACHGSNNDTSFPSIPNLKWQNLLSN